MGSVLCQEDAKDAVYEKVSLARIVDKLRVNLVL